jgi:O-antigen ligase
MNSKTRTLVIAIIAAVVLWLLGGFVFGKSIGMVFVIIGIGIVGLAAGNIMNSPEPVQKKTP